VQDYIDAGVEGVTAANLDSINAAVEALDTEDVDTEEELQAIADGLGLRDVQAPVFTSTVSVTVAENQTAAITLIATDNNGSVTYAISDGESADFDIDASTGIVTFKAAPDFETKETYGFTATATDSAGNSATQSVTIQIQDMPESTLKKTGQTKSYDENGTEVTDGSIKDDGYYQTGVDLSYTRDDTKEVVTDHITGLMWQDDADANTTTKPWLTQTNYDICTGSNGQTQDTSKCTDTSGDTAATYCADLTRGDYSDCRLPTIDELMYIADRSKRYPAIDTAYFQNVASRYYWSSTTVVDYEYFAWNVSFYNGYDNWRNKSSSYYVRCVRPGQQ